MSFLSRIFPWLYEELADPTNLAIWQDRINTATLLEKHTLATHKRTPARALTVLARDPNVDIRTILTKRLATLLPSLSPHEQVEVYDLTIEAIRSLAEDQVTAVRIALSSALKDVAKTPNDIARKLADDAERAVAEPILRYSLSLSDQDLLELISLHPQDWHPVSIAERERLKTHIGDAIAQTGNIDAGRALLGNDSHNLSPDSAAHFGKNPQYAENLKARNTMSRRFKRDWTKMTDQIIYNFLRDKVEFDQHTAADVLNKMHQHLNSQENLKNKTPDQLTEQEIIDALKLGENSRVIEALAARSKISVANVKRMLDSENGRAIVALCVKATMPMSFSTALQTKIARLPPAKIIYPKDGEKCPLSADELKFQWDFFGV